MTSHPEYNEKTTATEVADAFSDRIRNKNVVITGVGPNSLGEALALAIAAHSPAKLILASRTKAKLEEVLKKISTGRPEMSSKIELVILDLASQKSVREAVAQILGCIDHIDILINNAGLMMLKQEFTGEGIELQFGTNHIGHFLFTNLLLEKLCREVGSSQGEAGSTKIVNVTSAGHRLSPFRFQDYNVDGKPVPDEEQPPAAMIAAYGKVDTYNGWIAYGQSKTANILFSVALNERFRSRGIVSYAVHPGSIWTGLGRNLDEQGTEILAKTGTYWKSIDEGAAPMLVAALDPALDGPPEPNRVYISDCQIAEAAPWAIDTDAAKRLFELSVELVGIDTA
ncbi:short-chain dehydrogenase, putative [Talaromyces stipitatus ATCC 10500]|uniref:Short-chain dehydrogenase, putative n=1 Tax=Talaromyces stipitatus (strain ATCC 10500 / CBS 375.48 / QM 6759 / NRRL 1006) TaxID=441959 RepID=B8M1F3_TALSN|nr:short-chain dehydrogenase, putative [Talaromyces stipitatus ATCC 10500]EED21849.1 short-chain dehydrogenase, putative [Talaromyces stipitatus ATCC 10500]